MEQKTETILNFKKFNAKLSDNRNRGHFRAAWSYFEMRGDRDRRKFGSIRPNIHNDLISENFDYERDPNDDMILFKYFLLSEF